MTTARCQQYFRQASLQALDENGVGLSAARLYGMAGVRQKTHGAVLAEELELIRQNSANTNKNYIPNGTVIPIIMDLADEVEARLAELDVPLVGLINNAGMVVLKVVEHLTVADWNRTLWANFLGAVELTRLALPKLRASHGRIINNGSIAAWLNPPGYASYSASKAAMASWSRSLRSEVIPFGVAVSHIEPGNILTPGPVKALQTLKEQGETTYSVDNEDIPASYRDINAGLTNLFELGVKAGMPAQHVVDHIVHALTSPIPRDKYYVGPDAFLFNSILRCFGETVTDRAVRASVKMLNA
ncbi:hypothetical protein BDF22DRAFT_654104 [Syncephalis plumigaleata]|nr:hypothetical protein BDF22DRAFT_654104 [Syncephalis plumigaleata]